MSAEEAANEAAAQDDVPAASKSFDLEKQKGNFGCGRKDGRRAPGKVTTHCSHPCREEQKCQQTWNVRKAWQTASVVALD
eukprot:2001906-Rhodomonas_salina.3